MSEPEDLCFVVRNHEDHYSIRPAGREAPAGWDKSATGHRGPPVWI